MRINSIFYLWIRLKFHRGHFWTLVFGASVNLVIMYYIWFKAKSLKKNIIIINLIEKLGDIVACTPIASEFKRNQANIQLIWVVKKQYKEILVCNKNVDYVLAVSCLTETMILEKLGLYYQFLNLHFEKSHCSSCKLLLMKSNKNNINFDNYFFEDRSLLDAFARSGEIEVPDSFPFIQIDSLTKNKIDKFELPKNFVTIHGFSDHSKKNWNENNLVFISEYIFKKYKYFVVEVGVKSIFKKTKPKNIIDLCGKLTIIESAEVIRRSILFVGIDSGPSHLANALGVPGVIVLGKFHVFEKYNPYSGFFRLPNKAFLVFGKESGLNDCQNDVAKSIDIVLGNNKNNLD